jgi:hypothetical protein
MASIINSSTTSGLAATGDTSDELKLQTGGTDAVTVSSGQVCSFANNFGTVAGFPAYQCRAWVNFNGTGTVAIRASGNVTSITDNGTGDYTVNFTTAMPDANYVVNANSSISYGSAWVFGAGLYVNNSAATEVAPTTSGFRFGTRTNLNASFDPTYISVAIFR